jgi:phosphoribosylformylglycinamidine synthase PurS subunit
MKALVAVKLKSTVLDPQGQTIQSVLQRQGYAAIQAVRQGKLFELELDPELSAEAAQRLVETLAQSVLANPVIEDYRVQIQAE